MSTSDDPSLKRYHIWLDKDDMLWIEEMFGGHMKMSKVVRTIIRSYRKAIEAKAATSAKQPGKITDELRAEIARAIAPSGEPIGDDSEPSGGS